MEILGEPPLLQGGMTVYDTTEGDGALGGQLFGDDVIAGAHCGEGAAGDGIHIMLFANAFLLACTSALNISISCLMEVIFVFIDCTCALLTICIVLITSVMLLMLSSSLSDNSCAFAMETGTPTPLPEINRFS